MPVANKPPRQKNGYPKKTQGTHTDASAPIDRADKPQARDGSQRGRIKGSKNKATQLLEDAQALIVEKFGIRNWHPVTYMMLVAADDDQDQALRITAAAKAAPYVAGTMKSIEMTGDGGGPVQVDLTDARARLARMAGLEDDE